MNMSPFIIKSLLVTGEMHFLVEYFLGGRPQLWHVIVIGSDYRLSPGKSSCFSVALLQKNIV